MSPGEFRVYDSQERATGLINGEIREGVPLSSYDRENNIVIIPFSYDSYRYEVAGTDVGSYGLKIVFPEGEILNSFTAVDIPTTASTTHQYTIDWDAFPEGEKGVTLQIDADGDGVFEKAVIADNDLTYDEFILQTETIIDFDPDTLNLESKGEFATVYIELPAGFDVNQIDISGIILNDSVPALTKATEINDFDEDGKTDLMVKFERNKVQGVLNSGERVPIIVTGKVFHNGSNLDFKGDDIIKVMK